MSTIFSSTFSRVSNSDFENVALFINSITSKKEIKDIFITVSSTKESNSFWEMDVYPIISSNGTLIPTKLIDGSHLEQNSAQLYSFPIISSSIFSRTILLPSNTLEFSTNAPVQGLNPGEAILLKRTSKDNGKVTISFRWSEV